MASLRDAGASPPNSYWQARTPAVSSWRFSAPALSTLFPPATLPEPLRRDAGVSCPVRQGVTCAPGAPDLIPPVRPPVRPSEAFVGAASVCTPVRFSQRGRAGRESEDLPPTTRHSGVGRRLRVGGGAARHNLSNALNVTTVIRGGHNAQ